MPEWLYFGQLSLGLSSDLTLSSDYKSLSNVKVAVTSLDKDVEICEF